jgi:large subunit ribosomal protein L24
MAGLKIQRNDTVEVITGSEKDKGRKGRVLRVFPAEQKILVEGIRVIKKNVKPNPQRNIKGGVAEQEAALHISNVMLLCPDCGPTRVGFRMEGDTKVRVCRKCDKTLPVKGKKK